MRLRERERDEVEPWVLKEDAVTFCALTKSDPFYFSVLSSKPSIEFSKY